MAADRAKRTPTYYRRHKTSGQALVEIDGARIYPGVYDSPELKEK